jgi:hypothetical protein
MPLLREPGLPSFHRPTPAAATDEVHEPPTDPGFGFRVACWCTSHSVSASTFSDANAAERDDAYPQLALFSRVLQLIKKDYVDGEDL